MFCSLDRKLMVLLATNWKWMKIECLYDIWNIFKYTLPIYSLNVKWCVHMKFALTFWLWWFTVRGAVIYSGVTLSVCIGIYWIMKMIMWSKIEIKACTFWRWSVIHHDLINITWCRLLHPILSSQWWWFPADWKLKILFVLNNGFASLAVLCLKQLPFAPDILQHFPVLCIVDSACWLIYNIFLACEKPCIYFLPLPF